MKENAYIYILTNYTNTTLYIGVTTNLAKRIWEHKTNLLMDFQKNIT